MINLYERDGQHTYDSSPVIDADGTLLGVTRMIHITEYPCFHEQGYYTPGDKGAPVYKTKAGAIGVSICYDRHFPEYMRALAVDGADLVIVPQAGAVDEWPEGFVRSRDARRRVPERLLHRALQSRRQGRLLEFRGRIVRVWPGW